MSAPITMSRLLDNAALLSGEDRSVILGPRRLKHLVWIRTAIVMVAVEQGRSLESIGDMMAGRCHSTIWYYRNCGTDWLESDQVFEFAVRALREAGHGLIAPHLRAVRADAPEIAAPSPQPVPEKIDLFAMGNSACRKPKNDLSPDDSDARKRMRGTAGLIAAIRREHPERCLPSSSVAVGQTRVFA